MLKAMSYICKVNARSFARVSAYSPRACVRARVCESDASSVRGARNDVAAVLAKIADVSAKSSAA